VFFYSWLSFALWNGLTGWWISLAHWSGLVAVVFIAASLEALAIVAFYHVARGLTIRRAWLALPFLWMIPEWILANWDMEWPWLAMGYAFADMPVLIQWYSVTGVYGGSLWIVISNILIYQVVKRFISIGVIPVSATIRAVLWIGLPAAISFLMYVTYQEKGDPVEVVVVQPNIDPYVDKFEIPAYEQVGIFLREAQPLITDSTRYLVGPETLIPTGLDEGNLENESMIAFLEVFRRNYDGLHMVLGANTVSRYNERKTETARQYRNSTVWFDVYNTALQISDADSVPRYHKSKLVVGAEKMPFMDVLQPLLGEVVIDFGGISGTNRTQKNREVFFSDNSRTGIAPVICWESEFGEFVSDYVKLGAHFIFIITNDGWWGDSEGHRQHLHYARIRAIENRRAIARSANTGISAFINQRGDLIATLPWEDRGALRETIHANSETSIYTRYGDLLMRISLFLGTFWIFYGLNSRFKASKSKAISSGSEK
jgi:apolipoprotein N-acyltransferase